MRAGSAWTGLLVIALGFAGCLSAPAAPAPAAAPAEAADAGPPPAADPVALWEAREAPDAGLPEAAWERAALLTGCFQGHWSFRARAEDLAGFVPPGFAIASDAAGLTTVAVVPSRCEATRLAPGAPGAGAEELWIELYVVPPEEWAVEDAIHVLPIVGHMGDEALAARYQAWGFPAHAATFAGGVEEVAGALLEGTLTVDAPGGLYEWTAAGRRSGGEWGEYRFVRWAGTAEGVTGRAHLYRSPGESWGAGLMAMRHQGEEAPPLEGGIAHFVQGTDLALTWEPMPAAPQGGSA